MNEAPATPTYTGADRALEWALLASLVVHGLAIVSMATLLLPMLPGGPNTDGARVGLIAAHPWMFRLGWLPWQLCAVVDVWQAVAMVRVRWLGRISTVLVLLTTLLAVAADQYAQIVWMTRGVELAGRDVDAYFALERSIFPLTAGWGALGYTLAALGWTWCFARAGTWSRALRWLSATTWSTMLVAASSPLLAADMRPSAVTVAVANGLGFLQLQLWLYLVTEQVLRRVRPDSRWGRSAPWRYPSSAWWARLLDGLANSRVFAALLEPLPELEMRSDITNVVYVNYLIDAEIAAAMVPAGLELQRLGPDGQHALLSFLTYQHGHFGFAFMGPLRRLMPSPVQTNWRIHVVDPQTGHRGVYFFTNAVTHLAPALGARMLTEGMPMHVLKRGDVSRGDDGELWVTLDPGGGSAPDAELALRPRATPPELTGAWAECWGDFREFLAYCVPQDRAMDSQPLKNRVSRQEIDLGIPLDVCEPLEGSVRSDAARAIAGDAEPLCFRVPEVRFSFAVEAHDPRTA